jgi:anti-anti-sigma factor
MDHLYSLKEVGDITVIDFQTASLMNPAELERLSTALYRLADEEKRHRLLLDFTKVKYLSSQAIGIIITLNKKATQHPGGGLTLCGVAPPLMNLLKITRLDRVLRVTATQAEALDSQ